MEQRRLSLESVAQSARRAAGEGAELPADRPFALDETLVERYATYEASREAPAVYRLPDCIASWRNRYIRSMILPVASSFPGSRWLTVGDGYYGCDAHFLGQHGVEATASCLSETVLRESKAHGWIERWQVENAECLSVDDQSFDFVLAMETLQHCARPYRALYEGFRAARLALVLLNCIDRRSRPLDAIREWVRARLRGTNRGRAERYAPTAGYLYRLSLREMIKAGTALGATCLAAREFNLVPEGRRWTSSASLGNPHFLSFRVGIAICDLLGRMGLLTPGFSWFILFKEAPTQALRAQLERGGFRLMDLG